MFRSSLMAAALLTLAACEAPNPADLPEVEILPEVGAGDSSRTDEVARTETPTAHQLAPTAAAVRGHAGEGCTGNCDGNCDGDCKGDCGGDCPHRRSGVATGGRPTRPQVVDRAAVQRPRRGSCGNR